MSKDYYKILGVTEFESAENIKKAYRKLARKYHPDVTGNSADTILRFKEINEAYQILSNKIKKEEYDKARKFYNYAKGKEETTKSKENTNKNTTNYKEQAKSFYTQWENFISKKRQEQNYKSEQRLNSKRGDDVFTEIEISIFEALSGTTKTINMLQTQICPKCNGRKFVNGNSCTHCNGKGEISNHKKFTIKIPAEIKDKSKIRLAGEGLNGFNGGQNGDLYITINIKESKLYDTCGLDIHKTVQITPVEAILGTTLVINTPNGKVKTKLLPQTENGQKIRLSKCGLVQNNKIGDMIITVVIQIPKNISAKEIELYKQLGEISSSNIREV